MNAAGERRQIFRALFSTKTAPRVPGFLFLSANLEAHWAMLDAFEEGYDRVAVEVTTDEGQRVTAWTYQLQPKRIP
ncbi:AIG2 family protein [Klebsiella oxytoca]|nr:AIG2 family protein [Klebsiella oxytoca]